ncbi:MAG: 16S rRNA (cytosine(1402)-N(4))-methyltransferase RsmH, partial [Patescibacteria group bacterium]
WHLSESERGFSFQKDEPLDMRYSEKEKLTAREIINQWPPEEIEKILQEFGEEKFSRPISRAIIEARKKKPIISTFQLIEVIKKAVPFWYQHGRINFATKTFQALRIAVNDELGNLEAGLKQIPQVLKKGGHGVVISFHSLEDRIVKNRFKELKKDGIVEIITKKPVRPTTNEATENPRSRSGKLRAIKLITND